MNRVPDQSKSMLSKSNLSALRKRDPRISDATKQAMGIDLNDGKHQLAVLERGERVLSPEENVQAKKEQHGFTQDKRVQGLPRVDMPQMASVTNQRTGVNPPLFDEGGEIPDVSMLSAGREGAAPALGTTVSAPQKSRKMVPSMDDGSTDALAEKRRATKAAILNGDDSIDVTERLPKFDDGGDVDITPSQDASIKSISIPESMSTSNAMTRDLTPESMKTDSSQPKMLPLGTPAVAETAKPAPVTKPNLDVDAHRAAATDRAEKAVNNDDIIGLGKNMIVHNQLDKHDQANNPIPQVDLNAPSATAAADSMSAAGQGGGAQSAAGIPAIKAPATPDFHTPEGYKQIEKALQDKIIDPNSTPVEAAQAQEKLATLRQNRPESSRSTLDKVGHIIGRIAEPALMSVLPQVDAAIPGSKLNLGLEHRAAQANLTAAEEDAVKQAASSGQALTDKLAGSLLTKGYQLTKNAQTGEFELQQIPGFRDAPKSLQELIASRTQDAIDAGRDPLTDPKVQAVSDVMQSIAKTSAPSQEANKLAAQDTVSKIAKAGLSTDPKDLPTSIKKALANGTISAQAAADLRAYQAVNPNAATNLQVQVAGAEDKANLRKADKFFSYTDADGNVQLASGDKVPKDAEGVIPINDVKAFMSSADNVNLVQKTFTNLYKDNMKVFDNPAARAVLATALDDGQAAQAGILVAGTGGTITLPKGSGKVIDQMLENHAVPENLRRDVKDLIVDTWLTKDKLISLQMAIQNDKLGRGQQAVINAMYSQLPGSGTSDSIMAKRSLDGVQTMIDAVKDRYPDKYGHYTKEPSPRTAASSSSAANNVPAGATKVYKDKDGNVKGYAVNGQYVAAKP